jgi:prepilin peptidase CpaA
MFNLPIFVVLIGCLIAAVTDVTRFKVYNLLTYPLLLSGLVYHCIVGGVDGFSASVLGLLMGAGCLLVLFLLGGIGGGDVKLMGAVGAWLGWHCTFALFLVSALLGGVSVIALIVWHGQVRETWASLQSIGCRLVFPRRYSGVNERVEVELNRQDRRQRAIPFAAMVALGFVILLAASWLHGAS